MKQIRALNTLRGLAATIVVIGHYSKSTNLFGGYSGRGSGQFGVMLFFIISGFLMSFLYINKHYTNKNLKYFIRSRAARVLPLFLILVILSFLFQKIGITNILYNIPNTTSFISHILLLKGVSVFWTIPPEIHFYLLFIFMWWLYSNNPFFLFIFITISILIISSLDYPRYFFYFAGFTVDFSLLRALPYFFVGTIFGIMYTSLKLDEKNKSNFYLLSLIIIPILYPRIFEVLFGIKHGLWQDVRVLLCLSLVFFCCIFLTPKNSKFVSNKIGDFMGKISYSLYLLHIPILKHFKTLGKDFPLLVLLLYFFTTIILSYASYRYIENPLRIFFKYSKHKEKTKNE